MSGNWDSEVDVVIAGAGGAGLEAALECAAAGASAIVFEKQSRIWESSTALAVTRVAFFGTDEQKACGVEDSRELFLKDSQATGQGLCDPAMLEAYADHQLETYRQLCRLGIRWSPTVSVDDAIVQARLSMKRNPDSAELDAALVLDGVKGAAAVVIADRLTMGSAWGVAAAVASVVGHVFPVWLGFRGGKGVATAAGAFGVLAPDVVAVATVAFVLAVWVSRYISVGSMVAGMRISRGRFSCSAIARMRAVLPIPGRPLRTVVEPARRAALSVRQCCEIGTSTLPPRWPHFFSEASWSS